MAAPSHLHLHLPGCPQTLALPLPSPGGFSAWPGLRSCSRSRQPRIRPVAALGPADAGDLLGRVEAFLYTVADAAVNAEPVAAAADTGTKEAAAGDWLSGITNSMETVLKVESALAMRSLQPQVKAIQQRYAGDQERIQLETARLYKLSGVDPLAGCLPTLVTIPVWIGLYRALSNVANEGLLTEGFFWIPSLAGPTTIAARQNGQGISWLFPFTDGHPPLGWSDTLAYIVLPVLLVISQYISTQVMQPPQSNDPNQQGAQAVTKFLPLLIGYFALSVPSGLRLYWLTNNILSTAQQVWLQKLGGAKNPVKEYIDKLSREETTTVQKNDSTVQSEPLSKHSKPQPSQEPKPSGPQRGERFRKLKEEESMRKEVMGQGKQSEQSSSESRVTDGTQNSDVSSGDQKDQQGSHENGPVVASINGGVNHIRNEKTQNLSSEKNNPSGVHGDHTVTDVGHRA
uniref:Membrane insertase YidC/Oxa/ALB C-terminal domain-containing protein n=1 Tax=Zea mays TaxID=4577 RepID=A0A804P651_MAIZE